MYIKDTHSGEVREYGTNHHDSLRISNDGTYLTYEHLQCGDGSIAGNKEHSGYLFCDEEGHTPEEDEVLCKHGADAYFNIGGFNDKQNEKGMTRWIPVSEGLPEEYGEYLITILQGKRTFIAICEGEVTSEYDYAKNRFKYEWLLDDYIKLYPDVEVIAWQPLPNPYKAESEG